MADSHGCIVRIREKKIAGGNISLYLDIQREGLVDWDKVKKSRMTLTKWMDDFVRYNEAVRDGLIEQNLFLLLEAKEKPRKRVAEREYGATS